MHDAGTLCAINTNTAAVSIYLLATPPRYSPPTLSNRARMHFSNRNCDIRFTSSRPILHTPQLSSFVGTHAAAASVPSAARPNHTLRTLRGLQAAVTPPHSTRHTRQRSSRQQSPSQTSSLLTYIYGLLAYVTNTLFRRQNLAALAEFGSSVRSHRLYRRFHKAAGSGIHTITTRA